MSDILADCVTDQVPRRKRHKWHREPVRLEYETVRTCVICRLRKITDHNAWPPAIWYLDEATNERVSVMPECDLVE